ncbi:MAG: adenosylcobinamide amidohydrolase [Desulfotignum sp.]|nr:adenosylcobinamide amidohydrolase [Desulfotignum sp.]
MRFRFLYLIVLSALVAGATLFSAAPGACQDIRFTDSAGREIRLTDKPARIVSLVPSVTQMLFALGAEERVKGITYHTTRPWYAAEKALVGGYSFPSPSAIEALEPDLIFYDPFQAPRLQPFLSEEIPLVHVNTQSISGSMNTLVLLGNLLDRQETARQLVSDIQADLDRVSAKIKKADLSPKRVIRLMGRDQIMTPGSDSFQSDLISLAGGIPPDFGKGAVVPVSMEQWTGFNPQVIYGCGPDREAADRFFSLPGWKDVDAVKTHQVFYFPCDLTCRASIDTGLFVSRLFAAIHGSSLTDADVLLQKNQVTQTSAVQTDVPFVTAASVKQSVIHDFINKSLVISLEKPMAVLSTLEGFRQGVTVVGNHYIPPETWMLAHDQGLEVLKNQVLDVLGLTEETTALLFTGADMDHMSVAKEQFKDLAVTVFATAGVDGNAMRTGRDTGGFYEPGTINLIVMASQRLSPRAMTRALITATEGKTAALLDLDIRSSYEQGRYRATGTGTDNIIVVEGTGDAVLTNAGGHTKLGELIGKAVHTAVTKAIRKQNSFTSDLNIFKRLEKRGIVLHELLLEDLPCQCQNLENHLIEQVETLLLDPLYQGFMAMALAVSDEYDKGLVKDPEAFDMLCHDMASMIAGKPLDQWHDFVFGRNLSPVMTMALNALFNGAAARQTNVGEGA